MFKPHFWILTWLLAWTIVPRTHALSSKDIRGWLNTVENQSSISRKIQALEALGEYADASIGPSLVQAFSKTKNPDLRTAILTCLKNIPDQDVVLSMMSIYLQERLSVDDSLLIQRVVWHHRNALDSKAWIKEAKLSRDPRLQGLALWVLGIVGWPEGKDTLLQASTSKNDFIRMRSIQGLSRSWPIEALSTCRQHKATTSDAKPIIAHCIRRGQQFKKSKGRKKALKHQQPLSIEPSNARAGKIKPVTLQHFLVKHTMFYQLDERSTGLRALKVKRRKNQSIPLLADEALYKTFHLTANMITKSTFEQTDIDFLRGHLKNNMHKAHRCYLKSKDIQEKKSAAAKLDILVNAKGRVQSLSMKHVKGSKSFRKCIHKEISRIRFPKLENLDSLTFQYTLKFVAPKKSNYSF